MPIPLLLAICVPLAGVVIVAAVVVLRRRRSARLCRRFVAAATSGRFDEAERLANRWFDATARTGLGPRGRWGGRLSRLRPRRSRSHARPQERRDIRRRSVS